MAIVRRISARRVPRAGRIAIRFEVDAQTWQNMSQSARAGGFADTLDYVAATINMAFLEDAAEAAEGEARAASAAPAPAKAEFDDIDDDIPF